MFELVVFDLDGTLVDSQRDLASATNRLIQELGGGPLAEDAIARMVGEGARVLVQRALDAAGLRQDPAAALDRFLVLYDRCLLETTQPYAGMAETLASLSSQYRLAVLTNKPGRATNRILSGLNLDGFFADVIGGDSPFGRKPDPAALLELVSQGRTTPSSTLLVGDSAVDLETAHRAGTKICLARYGFGYRFSTEALTGDELTIDAPLDLIATLDKGARAEE